MWSSETRRGLALAVLAGLGLVLLGACGFQPVYGPRGVVTAQDPVAPGLARIYVEPLPDRLGQIVRNALIDRLTPRGQPARPSFRLSVKLDQRKEGLAIRQDETATRFNLILAADFTLHDTASNQPVFRGRTRAIAAYNVVRADFSTLTAEHDAQARAAVDLSYEIRNQILSYLSRRSGG